MKPTTYRICIRGRLTERLAAAFEGMRVEAGGPCTAITGRVRDQSELYGLLDRVSDLGLELISAQPLTSPPGIAQESTS